MGHKRLARLEEKKGSLLHQPVWLLGLVLMISGEIGNLAAYGDRGTPTAVITAVGCIGVVANLLIATLFLKEPFRVRDLMGGTMVVGGESPKIDCALPISSLSLGRPPPPRTRARRTSMLNAQE